MTNGVIIFIYFSAPPKQPTLHVAKTTNSSIELTWTPGGNHGNEIQGNDLKIFVVENTSMTFRFKLFRLNIKYFETSLDVIISSVD